MTVEKSICVYCASSDACDSLYHDSARELGGVLVANGYSVIYGGGAVGSMGALAEGVLESNGKVVGVMPKFMIDLEWAHSRLTELHIVEDMRIRKHLMLSKSQGLVALPGGSGTFEELFEAITMKRLGIYTFPIVILNTRGFYDPLLALLNHAVDERFMDERHLKMWDVVATPDEVPSAINNAAPWHSENRNFATVTK